MANLIPKPALLFTAHPLTGHLTPTLRIATTLSARGFLVYFLGPTAHRARIPAGITFLPLLRTADLDDLLYYSPDNPHPPTPDYWQLLWQRRGMLDFQKTWIDVIPDEWASVAAALAEVRRREAGREVVVVAEAMFFGVMPLFLGAEVPGGSRPRTVALSVTVPFVRSVDVPPFFVEGLGFGGSEEERRRNGAVWEQWGAVTEGLMERWRGKLVEAGAAGAERLEGPFLSGQNYVCHDRILQMGVPGLFYPRSDWPQQFKFIGVLPPAEEPAGGWPNIPPWWAEVTKAAETRKKVVVVAQGTVEVDPSDLIIPTIQAMAPRADNVLVVVILGRKGATLPEDVEVPLNARVTDYLHYDAVLPYASAWVHNGGYGALQHGIAHGVPMVVTGEGQDKIENAKRIEWCGAGVNLGRVAPGVEEVRQAVGLVLDDKKFTQKVRALQKESQELECFNAVEREVLTLLTEY
ncbi:UDP-Glycosyltransferase/glycogen phosphorylase [Lasiosphaeria hispida]|uniref:UDP-Glycosyltransferase/glycogen phosphorylase n=1 Tax=Lasiosphaeria hispida TaxID=260671 RepID=A0AAJ0H762_9PEZI|nr:UDP-Glycosyltransferase/glycogen phosphorylase [Lasiosphaeria hispida]